MYTSVHGTEGALEFEDCRPRAAPRDHPLDPTLRKEARSYHHLCHREERSARHIESLRGSLREDTGELLHRKACLHLCEPTCGLQHTTNTCDQARLRCREGVDGCTPEACNACMDTLGTSPLCSWSDCTMMSQNNCLRYSCDALYNRCRPCPLPLGPEAPE